ncbi:MAG: YfhO family protein [Bacteroidia bacterium]|nr:YfhO family protein [Bacteroidia bacterium]
MQKINFKQLLPHIVAVVIFLAVSYIYFAPQMQGKTLMQSDMRNYWGMSKEVVDFREATGQEALWTNSMFGGMPAYLISVEYTSNLFVNVLTILRTVCGRPGNYVFVGLLGFYIALLIFRIKPWLAVIGSLAFAFSSYFFIIIDAGHSSKASSIAYMAPIIAGTYLAFDRKILFGSILMGAFLAIQLYIGHLQITYYTFLIILVFGIFQFIYSFRQKELIKFFKATGVLIISAGLAIGSNASGLILTYEYGKDSMRGVSELTILNKENKTTGLDKDYATAWSYGKAETMTLLIPNFMGGSSTGELGTNSEVYELLKQNNYTENDAKQAIKRLPLYWGEQPFTSGPVYVGAIVFFLFILSLFIVKGRLKWWLLTITILSVLLAWGKNFMWFTDLFLDYFPGYNKFRSVSMILVIAEFAMPLLAVLGLKMIFDGEITKEKLMKPLKYTLIGVGGITLIFAILPGIFFDFTSPVTDKGIQAGFLQTLIHDRESILRTDAFRSLIFILLTGGLLYAYLYQKIKLQYTYIILALLILFDLWPVDKRYMNNDAFVPKHEAKSAFNPTPADLEILKDKDPDFRVLNLAANTFNDAGTSYFHKSIGGYHGAKMKRYQELIEFHISKNNREVWNMLNTKYIIVSAKDKGPQPIPNPEALGNAWFVKSYRMVANADSEITAMNHFKAKEEAIVDKRFADELKGINIQYDSTAFIKLTSYKPNNLLYESKASSEQLAVFSEIYYNKGWNAFIDNKPANHIRVNYVLRAMRIPAGTHKIEFKFEPKSYYSGNKISLASSALLMFLLLGVIVKEIIGKKNEV